MRQRLLLNPLLLLVLLLITSCGTSSSLSGTPITDKEFDAAVEQAHTTLGVLRQALLAPRPSYSFVGLKVRFTSNTLMEDIWTEPVDYFDGYFTTRMIDGVLLDPALNTDRLTRVSLDQVIDWVIVEEDGNLIGGYTIRLSYEHMTPEEREDFLRVTRYKIN